MEKLKQFFLNNKKKCAAALICIAAAILYCVCGSEIDQDKAVEFLCKIISC